MSVVVATGSWSGVHGDTLVTVCAPALTPLAGSPVALTLTEPPRLDVGRVQPQFSGGVLAVEAQLAVRDPLGVVAYAREAHPYEADVYADVDVPTGRADTPRLRWRLLVARTNRTNPLSPALHPAGETALDLRCGLGGQQTEALGTGAGQRLDALVAQALDLPGSAATPRRPCRVLLPLEADGAATAGPNKVRTSAQANGEGEPLGALTGDDGTAYDRLVALADGLSLAVYLDPNPANWRLRPGGDPAGDWATERAPAWTVVPRSRQGLTSALAYLVEPWALSAPSPGGRPEDTVWGDPVAVAPADWGADDEWDDLDPLRRLSFEPTPGAKADGARVEGAYSGKPQPGTSGTAYVGAVATEPALVYRCALQTLYDVAQGQPQPGVAYGRLYLRLAGDNGETWYGRPASAGGWTQTVAPACETVSSGSVTVDVPGGLPTPGRLTVECPGYADGNGTTRYYRAAASLVDPATGQPATVAGQVYRANVGFSGYADTLPLLPPMERETSPDVWAPVASWRSATANTDWDRLAEAQAAERACQEVRRLRTAAPSLSVVLGPGTRATVAGRDTDPDSPFGAALPCVLVGARVDCGEGTTEPALVEATADAAPVAVIPATSAVAAQTRPPAPTIQASGTGPAPNVVQIATVDHDGTDVDGYNLYRNEPGDPPAPLTFVPDDQSATISYTDTSADQATDYEYRATAVAGLESAFSNVETVTN